MINNNASHVEDYLYYRLVVCWFKGVLQLAHPSDTEKLRRMRELYPQQYRDAYFEIHGH